MRIENVGTTQSIPDKAHPGTLSQGDVLIAQVSAVDGDTVSLKSQDGLVLTARLLTDIGVRVGDFVETVVDAAGRGRYVLRIVDITRGGGDAELLLKDGLGAASTGAATRALLGTMAMLKMNPGVDPKAAVFLSQQGLSGTTKNLEILSQIVKGGETIGKLLAQVAGGESAIADKQQGNSAGQTSPLTVVVDAAGLETQQAAAQAETGQAQIAKAGVQSDAKMNPQAQTADVVTPAQTAVKTSGVPVNAVNQNAAMGAEVVGVEVVPEANIPIASDTAASVNITTAQGVEDNTVNAENVSNEAPTIDAPQATHTPQTPIQPGAQAIDTAKTGVPDTTKTGDAVPAQAAETQFQKASNPVPVSQQDDFKLIEQKAVSLFVRLDNQDDIAAHIKKAINELPEQLKELKILMERTDNMNKGRLEPAEKQATLLSQIKRFDCFHIPLMMQDNKSATAELYVYRHRNKKAAQDGENIVILLGLDTQHMGRVETLVKAGGKSLGLELFLEDMRLAEEVTNDADALSQAAQKLGYHKVTISIKKLAARTTLLNAEQRLTAGVHGSAGSVDIRI